MIRLLNIQAVEPQEIQQLANNYAIAKNLRDSFPFPYSVQDAKRFLELAQAGMLGHEFGLFFNEDFIGVAGIFPQQHEHPINAEIGY